MSRLSSSKAAVLSVFLVMSVWAAGARAECAAAWCVNLHLQPSFPEGYNARVHASVIEPYGTSYSIREDRGKVMLSPVGDRVERPSHVVIKLEALGFRAIELNTGLITYKGKEANINLPIEMEEDGAPTVENVVGLNINDPTTFSFEIALANKLDIEVSVTDVIIHGGHFGPLLCAADAIIYDITLRIQGKQMVGEAREVSGGGEFAYPVKGRVNVYCDDTWFSIEMPFNMRIPARRRAYLKFRIAEAEALRLAVVPGSVFFLAPDEVDRIAREAREGGDAEEVQAPLVDDTFSWSFGFVINKELYVEGASRPEESDLEEDLFEE